MPPFEQAPDLTFGQVFTDDMYVDNGYTAFEQDGQVMPIQQHLQQTDGQSLQAQQEALAFQVDQAQLIAQLQQMNMVPEHYSHQPIQFEMAPSTAPASIWSRAPSTAPSSASFNQQQFDFNVVEANTQPPAFPLLQGTHGLGVGLQIGHDGDSANPLGLPEELLHPTLGHNAVTGIVNPNDLNPSNPMSLGSLSQTTFSNTTGVVFSNGIGNFDNLSMPLPAQAPTTWMPASDYRNSVSSSTDSAPVTPVRPRATRSRKARSSANRPREPAKRTPPRTPRRRAPTIEAPEPVDYPLGWIYGLGTPPTPAHKPVCPRPFDPTDAEFNASLLDHTHPGTPIRIPEPPADDPDFVNVWRATPVRDPEEDARADKTIPSPYKVRCIIYDFLQNPPIIEKKDKKKKKGAVIETDSEDDSEIEVENMTEEQRHARLVSKRALRGRSVVSERNNARILGILARPDGTVQNRAQYKAISKSGKYSVAWSEGQPVLLYEDKPVPTVEHYFSILTWAHKTSNHGGRDKTHGTINTFFAGLPKEIIADYLRACPTCRAKRTTSTIEDAEEISESRIALLALSANSNDQTMSLFQARAIAATQHGHRPASKKKISTTKKDTAQKEKKTKATPYDKPSTTNAGSPSTKTRSAAKRSTRTISDGIPSSPLQGSSSDSSSMAFDPSAMYPENSQQLDMAIHRQGLVNFAAYAPYYNTSSFFGQNIDTSSNNQMRIGHGLETTLAPSVQQRQQDHDMDMDINMMMEHFVDSDSFEDPGMTSSTTQSTFGDHGGMTSSSGDSHSRSSFSVCPSQDDLQSMSMSHTTSMDSIYSKAQDGSFFAQVNAQNQSIGNFGVNDFEALNEHIVKDEAGFTQLGA